MKISVGAVLVLAASLLAVVVASCGSDTADPSVAAPASATPTSGAALTPTPMSAAALTPTPMSAAAPTPTPASAETPAPTPLPSDSTTPTRGSTQPPTPASTASNVPSPTSTLPPTSPSPATKAPPLRPFTVARAFEHLDFRGLTNLTQPAAGDDRLFVTEQPGRVLAFANDEETREARGLPGHPRPGQRPGFGRRTAGPGVRPGVPRERLLLRLLLGFRAETVSGVPLPRECGAPTGRPRQRTGDHGDRPALLQPQRRAAGLRPRRVPLRRPGRRRVGGRPDAPRSEQGHPAGVDPAHRRLSRHE